MGITDFAQRQLGDITFVELPRTDDNVAEGKEMGSIESVKAASELISPVSGAVLAANYLRKRLEDHLEIPYNRTCMHEFVASGVRALDIAKALLDKGHYAPAIYFPLIVKEALMIEPTETENLATLDQFVDDLIEILARAESDPGSIQAAPVHTPVGRLDEALAARNLELTESALPVLESRELYS